ncbi:hypothetical protein Ae201684_012571 [Aphanomyces euteiches]|uniref:Uncharacterized protein n=1 Tax=Aphanomyces euteiches TaxID=100861 RepID=A0A6G0WRA6_9STRA|nr:hypothetical protein Ae201684_012571 [Aphanomyces euteiches]
MLLISIRINTTNFDSLATDFFTYGTRRLSISFVGAWFILVKSTQRLWDLLAIPHISLSTRRVNVNTHVFPRCFDIPTFHTAARERIIRTLSGSPPPSSQGSSVINPLT